LNGKAGQQVGEMPVYKVTSDNQFGSVFIQPTTTKSITGTDVGEIQSFSLTGATPTTGVMNIAGVDVAITPTENTIASAADKIQRTLNNSTEFSSQGMTASYVVPTKEAVTATPSATETNTVTFQDLTVGQSVSFGGLKIAATGALTASDIATAFYTGRAPANGLLTGTLTGFSAGVPNIGVVKFTSTNVGSNITDVTPASSGLVAAPATPRCASRPGRPCWCATTPRARRCWPRPPLRARARTCASVWACSRDFPFHGVTSFSFSSMA
jgi:hypothetical protein